ncbi:MAG: DUF6527 family protein [Bacteroidota bacterium]|nr:DUF6527 family protein [Bacteroidota bacterium]
MKLPQRLEPEFVEFIPSQIEDGKLYVSMRYATVVHNCCCGCGNKVVTPLTRDDWKLSYNGENVCICPSIGNWSFPCQSHYWIRRGNIEWYGKWSAEEIAAGRQLDRKRKQKRHTPPRQTEVPELMVLNLEIPLPVYSVNWWGRLKQKLKNVF